MAVNDRRLLFERFGFFSEFIAEMRQRRRVSFSEMAEQICARAAQAAGAASAGTWVGWVGALGITGRTCRDWERKHRLPKTSHLPAIAAWAGVSLCKLEGWVADERTMRREEGPALYE